MIESEDGGMRVPGNANLLIGVGKSANQEIGVPVTSHTFKWHGRGYLPHFDGPELTQHVTFHLGDSLPKTVVERMEDEIRNLPFAGQDVERRKRVEAWIDAGHGCCVLREPAVEAMVQHAFQFFDGQRYRLLARGCNAEPCACPLPADGWMDGCQDRRVLEEIHGEGDL
jgi:hypothetical protein